MKTYEKEWENLKKVTANSCSLGLPLSSDEDEVYIIIPKSTTEIEIINNYIQKEIGKRFAIIPQSCINKMIILNFGYNRETLNYFYCDQHIKDITNYINAKKEELNIIKLIKSENIIFKNNLISLVWDDTRLEILDSDNNYIEYYFDSCFYDEKEQNDMIQTFINNVKNLNEKDLCNYLKDMFDSILEIKLFCGDKKTIQQLRQEWGYEYVVRIGNTALIIKE